MSEEAEVDILLFEVGDVLYGADASQVIRVDRPDAATLDSTRLGRVHSGQRALVFHGGDGEARLRVDVVHGVRSVAVHALRRMPRVAGGKGTLGVWLDGERPVVLVDLLQTRQDTGFEEERR